MAAIVACTNACGGGDDAKKAVTHQAPPDPALPEPAPPVMAPPMEPIHEPAPATITGTLNGVWSAGVNDVWAVGNGGTIAHFDGSWHAEPSPTTAALYDVWVTYENGTVWAVGEDGTIARRHGGAWSIIPSATPNDLFGVWGTAGDDVWAVGVNGIIEHWNGSEWTVSHDRGAGVLEAVSGSSSTDVWAVGGGTEPDGDRASLLLHWDGGCWTEFFVCNPEGNRFAAGGWVATLHDVWVLADAKGWAAGDCFPGGGFVPSGAVFQRTGAVDWIEAPGLGHDLLDFRPLASVFATGANDVWAASYGESDFAGHVPTMIHFDGAVWTASSQPSTTGIHDLGGTGPDDVWAVGNEAKRLHWDGIAWTSAP
jgi:hypothetical protein